MLLVSPGGEGRARPAREFFDNLQIYPGNKVTHIDRIAKALGGEFGGMLFFDDEERNRNVERERGVCFQMVRSGVSREEIDRGVRRWREARGKR